MLVSCTFLVGERPHVCASFIGTTNPFLPLAFLREVIPHFQSSGGGLQAAADRAQARRDGLAEKQLKAVAEAAERYEKETGTAG